jgi:hypothetical protein
VCSYQDVLLDVDGQKIHGWWVPSSKTDQVPVILHFHGNAGTSALLLDHSISCCACFGANEFPNSAGNIGYRMDLIRVSEVQFENFYTYYNSFHLFCQIFPHVDSCCCSCFISTSLLTFLWWITGVTVTGKAVHQLSFAFSFSVWFCAAKGTPAKVHCSR